MRPKSKKDPEAVVREIKRNTRRKFKPDEKIRIILEGLKGEDLFSKGFTRESLEQKLENPDAYPELIIKNLHDSSLLQINAVNVNI